MYVCLRVSVSMCFHVFLCLLCICMYVCVSVFVSTCMFVYVIACLFRRSIVLLSSFKSVYWFVREINGERSAETRSDRASEREEGDSLRAIISQIFTQIQ